MKKIRCKDGIAPWKIDNPIERWLGRRADTSTFWKKAYVLFYKIFDGKYYKKGVEFIRKQIDASVGVVDKKRFKKYTTDMVYSLHRFGCMFDEYFLFEYEKLNAYERSSFITDKIRWQYYRLMNKDENLEIFNNKKKAYDVFKEYFKRELLEFNADTDKDEFCNFFEKHKRIIVKPIDGSGGRGIFILNSSQFEKPEDAYALLKESKKTYVLEELIRQSSQMSALHPTTVNTVRVPTVRNKDGVVVFHPALRVGRGDTVVDNAFSGGIFAGVCPKTGKVITDGANEKNQRFVAHPDTGVVFNGFQVPRWDEAVAFVKKLATVVEGNNYVGWDIALTEDGWVLVEGNPRGQFVEQYATKKGVREELETLIERM